jgi:hypothetical protein
MACGACPLSRSAQFCAPESELCAPSRGAFPTGERWRADSARWRSLLSTALLVRVVLFRVTALAGPHACAAPQHPPRTAWLAWHAVSVALTLSPVPRP